MCTSTMSYWKTVCGNVGNVEIARIRPSDYCMCRLPAAIRYLLQVVIVNHFTAYFCFMTVLNCCRIWQFFKWSVSSLDIDDLIWKRRISIYFLFHRRLKNSINLSDLARNELELFSIFLDSIFVNIK